LEGGLVACGRKRQIVLSFVAASAKLLSEPARASMTSVGAAGMMLLRWRLMPRAHAAKWACFHLVLEAHDFSSSMSITTTHSKNKNDSKSVVSQKTLAKSVFSVGTSKITSDGSGEEETDKDDGSDYEEEGAAKSPGVEIERMQMLTREQSGRKDKSEGNINSDTRSR